MSDEVQRTVALLREELSQIAEMAYDEDEDQPLDEPLADRVKALRDETIALRARVAELEARVAELDESNAMACENPCGACSGCFYADEVHRRAEPLTDATESEER